MEKVLRNEVTGEIETLKTEYEFQFQHSSEVTYAYCADESRERFPESLLFYLPSICTNLTKLRISHVSTMSSLVEEDKEKKEKKEKTKKEKTKSKMNTTMNRKRKREIRSVTTLLPYGTHEVVFEDTPLTVSFEMLSNPSPEMVLIKQMKSDDNKLTLTFKEPGVPQSFVARILRAAETYCTTEFEKRKRKLRTREGPRMGADSDDEEEDADMLPRWLFNEGGWQELPDQPGRSLDTVFLKKGQSERMVSTLEQFFTDRRYFADKGIAYKRVFLLEGEPGGGKTTWVRAAANHFGYGIAEFTFSPGTDDVSLKHGMATIPDHTWLLLEDVDALFCARKQGDEHLSRVSFSGLINALDGLNARKGLVVFMTTNHKEKLDKALLRPGRTDIIETFSPATSPQIKRMFMAMLPEAQHKHCNTFLKKVQQIAPSISMSAFEAFFLSKWKSKDIMEEVGHLKEILETHEPTGRSANSFNLYG